MANNLGFADSASAQLSSMPASSTAVAADGGATEPLRCLTLNIWFSSHQLERRMAAISSIISTHQPHVIALQEMTDDHWAALNSHASLSPYTWTAPPSGGSTGWEQDYYTMMGVLRDCCTIQSIIRRPFQNSGMDRDLLSAIVKPWTLPALRIGTSHLESLNLARQRREQMNEALSVLSAAEPETIEDAMWCGDSNINEAVDGIAQLPRGWKDAWLEIHPDSTAVPGFTFDVERNGMLHRLDRWARSNAARLRFDRFWVRLANYRVVGAALVGTERIPPLAADAARSDFDASAKPPAVMTNSKGTISHEPQHLAGVGRPALEVLLPSEEQGPASDFADWWPSDHFGLLVTLLPKSSVLAGAHGE